MIWYLTLAAGWLVALGMLPVLARRYSPSKAWGWLAVMFAFPWAGLVLFGLFAENPLGRRRAVRYREVLKGDTAIERLSEQDTKPAASELSARFCATARTAEACGALPLVRGNAIELSHEHARTLDRLIGDIDAAERYVNLVFYIIRHDSVGDRLAEALIRAAGRGVVCRVVADALGSRRIFNGYAAKLRNAGVEIVPAKPFWPLKGRFARLDLRNHRKIAVIDGRVGYLGSWNVMDPDSPKRLEYHDLMARVQGPAVMHLGLLFLEDWILEAGEKLPFEDPPIDAPDLGSGDSTIVQVLPSGPLYPYPPVSDLTVELLGLAHRRVIMTTPYFAPDDAVMLSLRLAAQRGAEVNVVVPIRSDTRITDAAGRAYCAKLVQEGVRVHCYQAGFLHTKSLSVDGQIAMIGSANFDMRSFRLDIETNMLLYTAATVRALTDIQEEYLSRSVPFEQQWGDRNWLRRITDDIAKLGSPLA